MEGTASVFEQGNVGVRRARTLVAAAAVACVIPLAAAAPAFAAKVAVFDNNTYVDTEGTASGNESDNLQGAVAAKGHEVSTFTGVSASDFSAALAGRDVLLIPEQENGALAPDLSEDARNVIRNFVGAGGGFVIGSDGENGNTFTTDLMNALFAFSTASGDVLGTTNKTPAAAGTEFAAGPASLPENNATEGLLTSSLPATSKSLYSDASLSSLAVMYFGSGSVTYLGWDWFNSNPPNAAGQDGDWLSVLDSSVRRPSLSLGDAAAVGEGGVASFGVSLSEPVSEVVIVNFATANGTAAAPGDFTAQSGTLSFARGDTSTAIGVATVLDNQVEADETFSVDLSSPVAASIGDSNGGATITNVLRTGACANARTGTNAGETLNGSDVGDLIRALGGIDIVNGLKGDDCLAGDDAADRLDGGDGNDQLAGGGSADIETGGAGNDKLGVTAFGGDAGNDKQTGGSGNDTLLGGSGKDNQSGGPGKDVLSGGSGNDRLNGGSARDRFSGGRGNDIINSADGRRETVSCGRGKRDVARVDRRDRVRGCERVIRRR
jgi:Ca2+-binding RTX toxin-like protein